MFTTRLARRRRPSVTTTRRGDGASGWASRVATAAMIAVVIACHDPAEPAPLEACWLAGTVYFVLAPEPVSGYIGDIFRDYDVPVGDSLQVDVTAYRIVEAYYINDPMVIGPRCIPFETEELSVPVAFTSSDEQVARTRSGGWIHGVAPGVATVTIRSTAPPVYADTEIRVLVTGGS